MPQITVARKSSPGPQITRDARRLFHALTEFMSSLEDILEKHGDYREDFLRDLRRSLREVKRGKTIRINSLQDLR